MSVNAPGSLHPRHFALAHQHWDETVGPQLTDENIEAFVGFVDSHGEAGWSGGHLRDLFVAWSAACGDPKGVGAFVQRCEGDMRRAIAQTMREPADVDEVVQRVLEHLLVGGHGRKAALLSYSGRGDLAGFVRVAAARRALNYATRAPRELASHDAILHSIFDADADPETQVIRQRCKSELREGFCAALASLSVRDRTLIRYSLLDGMSVDTIGSIYRVHRATAARWVSAARGRLLEAFHLQMSTRLGVSAAELESLVRWARSAVDLSIERCFAEVG